VAVPRFITCVKSPYDHDSADLPSGVWVCLETSKLFVIGHFYEKTGHFCNLYEYMHYLYSKITMYMKFQVVYKYVR
jgi:hypothetical protein